MNGCLQIFFAEFMLWVDKNGGNMNQPIPEYELGDFIKLKKKHPCGSQEWEILRIGADFRLKCLGCGHQIMMPRRQVEKNTREVRKKA